MTATRHHVSSSLCAVLADAERAGLRRPWKVVVDRAPARDFKTGKSIDVLAPVISSLRILDADNRLIVRYGADREQALTAEDMVLIVEAINAL